MGRDSSVINRAPVVCRKGSGHSFCSIRLYSLSGSSTTTISLPVACPGRGRADMANGYGGGQVFALFRETNKVADVLANVGMSRIRLEFMTPYRRLRDWLGGQFDLINWEYQLLGEGGGS